nr:hypothetical protein [Tanacetum cinerariifolium]
LLETTVRRVVPLLPIAPARASSELEASVDKLFDEGVGGDGQGVDIQPVIATTGTIVEDVAPLRPSHQRKIKIVVADASKHSHPSKKSREDYGAMGGDFAAGKSRSAVKSLFTEAVLNAEARGEPILTLPFVTSSVFATPEHSFYHSGANIAEGEVDSIVMSSTPAFVTVTTVTAAVDAATTADRVPVEPSLFGGGSSSTGRTDSVPGGFSDVSGNDFLIGGICTVVDPDSDLQKVYAELLKVKDGEIENLKAQLLLKEAEAVEAIRLRAKVFKFEATEKSLQVKVREQEVAELDAQVTAVKLQNDNLVGQLEKFQDEKIEEVNKKFDKLCVDFVEMALHLEEKFYPHLLTTIFGRRWLLAHGIKLAIVKCLNSTEYLSALGAAISKAVEKGMREGLSAGITHSTEGRKLADVAAYNPSAKADYLSALQRLQNVNFSLIAKLKSNKDASVNTIMNLFRLDDTLAERLGLTESQPHANQLMVPIHHSPDQRVIGASALSLYLDVSHSQVWKIIENVASHVSALRDVFIPLTEPLSAAALEGTEGTSGSAHDTTTALSVTFVSAGTIPLISTDDYEIAHADGQEGPSVDGETTADENINPFSDVSNAELNILE